MNEIKSLGIKTSALGMGCMRYPTKPDGKIDHEKSIKMMELCYESGINYYDTAYVYHGGESETFIAKALKKYPRDSYFIADKLPCWDCKSLEDVDRIFDEELKRLDTDYIDFLMFHGFNKNSFKEMMDLGAYDHVLKKKKKGQIRYLGFSFHDNAETLDNITDAKPWDFAMLQINYMDWIRSDAAKLHEIMVKKQIPCMVMEPVRGGALANFSKKANAILKKARPQDSIASWAIRFAASLENVPVVLSGMSDLEQIKDNLKTVNDPNGFTGEDMETIKRALEVHGEDAVPCTQCKYCMPCPEGVDIAKAFFEYNHHKTWADIGRLRHETNTMRKENTMPDKCTSCMVCVEKCPQKIDIPTELKKAEEYANMMV